MTDPIVQAHLRRVVTTLRRETPSDLPAPRRARRLAALDALDAYADAGRFPRPDGPVTPRARHREPPRAFAASGARAPIFEDRAGVRCAVGHLLGLDRPDLVARIRDADNGVYVPELDSPELDAWAEDHGFSRDDLAWIQPGYCWEVPTCDEVVLEAPTALGEQCEGPDASFNGADFWYTSCQECDGPYRVYAWVQNAGTETATDVTVTLGSGETTFDTATGITVAPGEVVQVELQAPGVRDLGEAGFLRVSAAGDCFPDWDELGGWETGGAGPGYVEPAECGGGCDDTGVPSGDAGGSDGCGCGGGSEAAVALGLGLLGIGAGRRRTPSR